MDFAKRLLEQAGPALRLCVVLGLLGGTSSAIGAVRAEPVSAAPSAVAARSEALLGNGVFAQALRKRAVTVNRAALSAATTTTSSPSAKLSSAGADGMRVQLFDDAVFTLDIHGVAGTSSGGTVSVGRVAGVPDSSAVVVDNNGAIHIAIAAGDRRYTLQGTPELGYVAAEVPLTPSPHADDAYPAPAAPTASTTSKKGAAPVLAATAKAGGVSTPAVTTAWDSGDTIDIMVLYTPASRAAFSGKALVEAAIDAEIAWINQIYTQSGVTQRLRLVYKGEYAYTETDAHPDLITFNKAQDILAMRQVSGADLVTVWGNYPPQGTCGVAFVGDPEQVGNTSIAVSVVNAPNCIGPGGTVMAHELGHIMGLNHDPYTVTSSGAPAPSILLTPEGSTTPTRVYYAAGYLDVANRFRTIMSYDSCTIRANYQCRPIPYFSNPGLSFDNSSFYAGAAVVAMGDAATGDEHRALNDTRESIVNFMPARATVPPAGGVIVFTEPLKQVQLAPGAINLTVKRYLGTSGAVTVSYATALVPDGYTPQPATHYAPTSGTLTWADGDNADKVISIPLLLIGQAPDREYFNVSLTLVSGNAELGTPAPTNNGSASLVTIIGGTHDAFPPGGVVPLGYASPGTTPATRTDAWSVDFTRGYQSAASLVSAAETATAPVEGVPGSGGPGVSDLTYTGEFLAGNITFRHLVSGIATTASLEFSIDGVTAFTQAGGQTDWSLATVPITAGTHTLRWRYSNTGVTACNVPPGAADCLDRAWLDDISLPVSGEAMSHYSYIADGYTGSVKAIDLATGAVAATIPVGAGPAGVAAHPDGLHVYVANNGGNSVSVIDTLAQSVTATISVGAGPVGIALDPSGARAYVVNRDASIISVIDTATNTRLADIAYAGGGTGIAINAAGTRAYVALGDRVQAIDLTNQVALAPVSLGGGTAGGSAAEPVGVAVRPDDAEVYIAQNGASALSVLDTTSNTITATIALAGQPTGIAFNPRAPYAYAALDLGMSDANNYFYGKLAVIDIYSRSVKTTLQTGIGQRPIGVAVSADGGTAHVANEFGGTVSIVDTVNLTATNVFSIAPVPRSIGKFIAPVSVPGAPGPLSALVDDGALRLSFPTFTNNGGRAVQRYEALCQPGNAGATAATSPVVVSGLANGTAYTCRVRAVTTVGNGAYSAPVTATPSNTTYFTNAATVAFDVLNAGSFTIATAGAAVAGISYTGTLPAGVTLTSGGLLSGIPASGTAGNYPLTLTAGAATQNFTLTVRKLAQAQPTLTGPSYGPVESGPFAISVSGPVNGNAVVVSDNSPSICTLSGNTVTPLAGGNCSLQAQVAGSTDYSASPVASLVVTVTQRPILSFGAPPDIAVGQSAVLHATSSPPGLESFITYGEGSTPVCVVVNGSVVAVTTGTCTVLAFSPVRNFYDAAQTSMTFQIVRRGAQVITVSNAGMPVGQSGTRVLSSGSSGNPVILATSTPSVCSLGGAGGLTITMLTAGTCTLTANQAGNDNYQPAAEVTFSLKAYVSMLVARYNASAALLPDGRVLVAGGYAGSATGAPISSAEIYDPATGMWTAAASMTSARAQHTATVLLDGRVLVAGGTTTAAEIYDPATGNWSAAGAMSVGRLYHTATRLSAAQGGKVMVAGGWDDINNARSTTEIYNPATNTWSAGPNLKQARAIHTALLMDDGRIMLAGGLTNINAIGSTEYYDPVGNTWNFGAGLVQKRNYHTATKLNDGKILLAGGVDCSRPDGIHVSCGYPVPELFDPATGSWRLAGGTTTPRNQHTATLLPNGRVLLLGGVSASTFLPGTTALADTVLYDPSERWTTSTPLSESRWTHTATLLNDGTVLIAGGGDVAYSELYAPNLALLSVNLAAGAKDMAYTAYQLPRAGGSAPFTHALTSGALPAGMSFSVAGVLSGTPTATGGFDFGVTLTDGFNVTATQTYHLDVGYLVTPQVTGPGNISPSVPQGVAANGTIAFTLIPSGDVTLAMGGTCGGTLAGNVYTTNAVNTHCTVTATFTTTAPKAPTIGTATAGNGQATVTFTAPSGNGGATITGYIATSSPDGRTASCTAPCTSLTLTGLSNGTAYTFTVAAINGIGTGPNSAASNAVTPKGTQAIVFGTAPVVSVGGTGVVTATGGASGNPVVFSVFVVSPARCSISGNVVTGLTNGNCLVLANQAGSAAYNAAPQASQLIAITGLRTITPSVTNPVGGTIAPSTPVTAANGATRVFTVQPNSGYSATVGGTCGGTLVGTTFTTNAISGDCTVIATFTAGTAPDAPVIGTATPGNHQATIAFTPPANNGGSAITSYTATCGAASASGTASPITVMGLNNGAAYTCSVTATNAIGTGSASGTVGVTPSSGVVLSSVVSRKTHGTMGDFDIVLDTSQDIAAAVTVEPRMIGTGHRIVFHFDRTVETIGTVTSVDVNGAAIGTVQGATITGSDLTVTLTGVPDVSRVLVSVPGVNGTLGVAVAIGFLAGDVNGSRSVNASDINGVKARSGEDANSGNFKFDLNASGTINTSDISAVKARSGNVL